MHDIRFIREQPEAFDEAMNRRGLPSSSSSILEIDGERRAAQTAMQEAQAKRNDLSKQVGEVKRTGGDAAALMQEVAALKDKLAALETQEKELGVRLDTILSGLPNRPADDVPLGKDERDNRELRRAGAPKGLNAPRQHYELGEALGLMDFTTAVKLSGARFTMLRGALARMERALGNFMLDIHTTEFGYTEISPPLLVRDEMMYGTSNLPKFAGDAFGVVAGYPNKAEADAPHWWLIPTAEVPLTNIVNGDILNAEDLPYRFTAKTACFRSEAGSAGKDTRGMLRQHQFYKVEMVSITTPEQSAAEHERMTECAETILSRLELPFRTVVLCSGDMGFGARKTHDIEVWLPGQNAYREISSCSNCGDFQARRMNARCRAPGDKATTFAHTLNGSGVAIGRCLIAIMENFQQPDGSIIIPTALRRYMDGMERIQKAARG